MLNFKLFRIIFVFNILIECLCLYSDKVRKYDPETFKMNIGESVPQFISFYAPWSPISRRLQPVWDKLAEKYNLDSRNQKLVIAMVDCTSESPLCVQERISEYPSLLFYNAGEKQGVQFKGPRSSENLEKFIAENLKKSAIEKRSLPVMTPGGESAVELTDDNYHSFLRHGLHFVKFYAPWCVHSQNMAAAWEELARDLQDDQSVTISSVDCTKQKKACQAYEVKRYPSLLWIVDGNKVEKFKGKRTVENFKQFIIDMKRALREKQYKIQDGRIPESEQGAVKKFTGRSSQRTVDNFKQFIIDMKRLREKTLREKQDNSGWQNSRVRTRGIPYGIV